MKPIPTFYSDDVKKELGMEIRREEPPPATMESLKELVEFMDNLPKQRTDFIECAPIQKADKDGITDNEATSKEL